MNLLFAPFWHLYNLSFTLGRFMCLMECGINNGHYDNFTILL